MHDSFTVDPGIKTVKPLVGLYLGETWLELFRRAIIWGWAVKLDVRLWLDGSVDDIGDSS